MPSELPNFIPAVPEMFVLFMALVILLAGVFIKKRHQIPYYLTQITLILVAGLTWYIFTYSDFAETSFTFHHMFVLDRFSVYLKLFIYLSVFFAFIYAREYNDERKIPHTEFYVLGLLSMLGMVALVSSSNLLTVFLGLELLSLPTYAMVALYRNKTRSVEAGMKYFVIGAIASGMLLYGMSMIFGATQSLDLTEIAKAVSATPLHQNLILVFGLVFIVAGVAFKLGTAPFHMWVPDVYEGAPSSVTLFISTAPKIAAYAMIIRLLILGMPALHVQWHQMLIVVAILSMGIGNFAAIVQSNIKRMLAYSSIAHMGYMLLGVLCGTRNGYAAAMFYTITYSLMSLGAFGMVVLMSRGGFEAENINDFAGLNSRNPWLAFMMMLILFSLAGVPPLVGFIAKVGVLDALIQVHLVWLAVLAVLFAIVGAYYYIRVVKVMYFESAPPQLKPIRCSLEMKIAISLNGLAVLFIGIFPGWLYALSHLAF
ncbi:NADH:ubiquinone oxidoreductase subunit N [Coxiella burnetii]|uniref:NADH-quinone oxidoreductase subunit N n=1 Tax=Coxiella burnetii (strain RSA 493 / Nine Mile phase I) TaxID=227377 RepID=NUON_COXBU|nr:NADH-quinone oxidoreductase subunit NuoN [Coxiella burnetii]NP_820418.1 NADH-quinone oxidoreductase subunit N [Coxiella burnetii RSA 493]Q83BR8.1 RecName: Full=NADH-quinone oxidoreductase subunit N; AltName: Full=NADH dehydrogenase I subunit N; AltName: Full=NDH-1 subunit N [Coxiella burnetii RSA 493]AAO90932.1 NADH-quinone oxidoreductase chain N [Coxiella burnetii RSA 493]ABX79098.1 NADH dehydrogenase (ubiquinone), N subunit [Coxiella burnetii RSA 331]AML48668.1 NADH:ubiquinone oxidoreduct